VFGEAGVDDGTDYTVEVSSRDELILKQRQSTAPQKGVSVRKTPEMNGEERLDASAGMRGRVTVT